MNHIRLFVSKRIRKFCSDVIIQLIERLSPLVKLYVSDTGVKTVTDRTVMFTFNFLLTDWGSDCEGFYNFVNHSLDLYNQSQSSQ